MNKLTEAGWAAYRAAARGLLADALEQNGWDLTETARALGLEHGSSQAIQFVHRLGLTDEYRRAQADGRIRHGRRPSQKAKGP